MKQPTPKTTEQVEHNRFRDTTHRHKTAQPAPQMQTAILQAFAKK
jgi:hypothetical protein